MMWDSAVRADGDTTRQTTLDGGAAAMSHDNNDG